MHGLGVLVKRGVESSCTWGPCASWDAEGGLMLKCGMEDHPPPQWTGSPGPLHFSEIRFPRFVHILTGNKPVSTRRAFALVLGCSLRKAVF